MPVQTAITKIAVANQNQQRWKEKKRQTYQDDPEEHEGLLGEDQEHDNEDEVGRGVLPRRRVQLHILSHSISYQAEVDFAVGFWQKECGRLKRQVRNRTVSTPRCALTTTQSDLLHQN